MHFDLPECNSNMANTYDKYFTLHAVNFIFTNLIRDYFESSATLQK